MLYLTSWNIGARQASEKAKQGLLVNIGRGVYVQPDDDTKEMVAAYAFRIANHLCPNSVLLGPHLATLDTINSEVFMSSLRKGSREIGQLKISMFREKENMPKNDRILLKDPAGELEVPCSPPGKALIDTLALHESGIINCTQDMWVLLLQRASNAIKNEATLNAVLDQVERSAKLCNNPNASNQVKAEIRAFHAGRKQFSVNRESSRKNETVEPTLGRFDLRWYGRKVGHINISEYKSEMIYNDGWVLPLGYMDHSSSEALPPFIDGLLPDRTSAKLSLTNDIQRIGEHGRFLSNIAILRSPSEQDARYDHLEASLASFADQETNMFVGSQDLVSLSKISASGISRELSKGPYARLSGVQVKVPCNLSSDGLLSVADGKAFTHILKLPGQNQFSALGLVEWAGMSMAKAAELDVASFAGVQVDGQGFCFLTERFDIPGPRGSDQRLMMQEDVLSLMNQHSVGNLKYSASIEHAGIVVGQASSNPEIDKAKLFHMAFAAAVTVNPDMHLKNIAVLKTANPTLDAWKSVEMAPVYDFVAAAGIPLMNVSQALSINGKQENVTSGDFLDLAYEFGLDERSAAIVMGKTTSNIFQWCCTEGLAMIKFAGREHPDEAKILMMSVEAAKVSALKFHTQALESCDLYASLFASDPEPEKDTGGDCYEPKVSPSP